MLLKEIFNLCIYSFIDLWDWFVKFFLIIHYKNVYSQKKILIQKTSLLGTLFYSFMYVISLMKYAIYIIFVAAHSLAVSTRIW